MSNLQQNGVNSPVLFTTATQKINALATGDWKFWPNDYRKSDLLRSLLRYSFLNSNPADAIEVLDEARKIYAQRVLEESLLSELQNK